MLPRSAVRWVEAQGDYARLHTADASHLVRVSLAALAERWADAGFVRIHRSYLVALRDCPRAAADRLRLRRARPATASCRSAAGTPASSRTG